MARKKKTTTKTCTDGKEVLIMKAHENAVIPEKMTAGAAGFDLTACHDGRIISGGRMLVDTGLKMAIPEGYEAQVRPRSGLSIKNGVTVLNAPGTIDSDYRGKVGVVLINHGTLPFVFKKGDRIAQIVFNEVAQLSWSATDSLPESDRGEGGFGSTGGVASTDDIAPEPITQPKSRKK